jgi:hypothetical protein
MEAFIRSNKAVWLMLIADFLAVLGWFIVKLNGGTEMAFSALRAVRPRLVEHPVLLGARPAEQAGLT